MPRTRTIALRIAVALIIVGLAVLALGVWWASSLYQSGPADAARADAAFAEVRARFPGVDPAFDLRDGRLVTARQPPAVAAPTAPAAVHLLIWQPAERTLSRITVPLWMSRVATEPLPIEALAGVGERGLGALLEAQRRGNELNVRIGDLERYGPTLLLDGVTPDGKHVVVWNQ